MTLPLQGSLSIARSGWCEAPVTISNPAMNAIRRTMGPIEWAMLLALSLIWGGSFLFNAVALRGFPPLTVVALRVTTGAACLWLVILVMGYAVPRDARIWLRFLVM